ncbi:MAG: hypothetical protein OSA78_07920 [Flavobacteriales bacterium]|nr:hypothetical protein [Flavobacteriales bacterium]
MWNSRFVTLVLFSFCAFGNPLSAQEEFVLIHDGLERTYLLDLPDGETEGMPLVLVLHAYVSSANIIRGYSGWADVAESGDAVVCYPQGTLDDFGFNHWNANLGISETDDIGFLSLLVETLQEQYGLSAACTFSCGMSNGGFMSYTLACERPDLFSAIGSVAGNMSAYDQVNCNPETVLPIIHLHGTLDPTVSYNQGVILDGPWSGGWGVENVMGYWTGLMGTTETVEEAVPNTVLFDLSTVDFIRHYGASDGQEFHHYRVNGGFHDWFGSWGNQDINSTDLLWEFFSSACEETTNSIASEMASIPLTRKVVRVMDLMGRTTNVQPNRLQLYLYSDGSVEKRIQIN